MSWRTTQLAEFIEINHGFPFKSKYFADDGRHIVLTPGNCNERGGLRLRADKEKYYTGDIPQKYLLEAGDMLVVMTDLVNSAPILGGSFLIPEDDRYLHNQRLGLVEVRDTAAIDRQFLYYLLNTETYRAQVRGSASGATVRHTSPGRIKECRVRVPDEIGVQRRIGEILRAYDDLIENNTRRIKLLEDAARLLYEEWFVRLRFPGHEHTPIHDGVPEGWERKRFSEICETVGGGTPSTKVLEYWDGDITWVVPSDVTKNDCLALLDSERHITERGLRESSAKIVPPETILMTSRASVGFFALMDHEVCTNQGFINIIPHSDHMRMYLLFNLMSRVDEIRSNAKGTTYPEISKGRFRDMDMLVPTDSLATAFNDAVYPMVRQLRCLKKKANALQSARDLLLPRLMTGEVAV